MAQMSSADEDELEEEFGMLDEATRRILPLSVLDYIHSLESKLEAYQVR